MDEVLPTAPEIEEGPRVVLSAAAVTSCSPTRLESYDRSCLLTTEHGDPVLLLCSGIGEDGKAEQASREALEFLQPWLASQPGCTPERLKQGLALADTHVRLRLCRGERDFPGASVVVAGIADGLAHFAWVGICRAIVVREGVVVARSRDHTIAEDLVKKGRMTREEAMDSPIGVGVARMVGGRSVDDPPVEASLLGPFPLREGDQIVLLSSAVTKIAQENEVLQCANVPGELEMRCRSLAELVTDADRYLDASVVLAEVRPQGAERALGTAWAQVPVEQTEEIEVMEPQNTPLPPPEPEVVPPQPPPPPKISAWAVGAVAAVLASLIAVGLTLALS